MRTTETRQSAGRSDKAAANAALLAGVLILLAIVAIASEAPLSGVAGPRTVVGGGGPDSTDASPPALILVLAGAIVALLGLAAYRSWRAPRRRKAETVRAPLWLRIAVFLLPLAIAGVIVDAAITGSHRQLLPPSVSPGKLINGRPRTAGAAPLLSAGSSFSLPTWVPLTILALAVVATLLLLARRIAARSQPASAGAQPAAAVKAAVEASLDDLRADPDARRAVIASYRRMEATLAAAGLPRASAEAPREYLVRALGSLAVSPEPPRTLTALFERARFSLDRIDRTLRDAAIDALVSMQQELEAIA